MLRNAKIKPNVLIFSDPLSGSLLTLSNIVPQWVTKCPTFAKSGALKLAKSGALKLAIR